MTRVDWRYKRRHTSKHETGFITIWMLGVAIIVIALGGISLDLWRTLSERRQLAVITDGAAIAAASQIDLEKYGGTPSVLALDETKARDRVIEYVTAEAAAANITVDAVDVRLEDNDQRVVVTTTQRIDAMFTKIFAPGTVYTVVVTGAAEPRETA